MIFILAFVFTVFIGLLVHLVSPDPNFVGSSNFLPILFLVSLGALFILKKTAFGKAQYEKIRAFPVIGSLVQGYEKAKADEKAKSDPKNIFALDEIGNYRAIEFGFPKVIKVRVPESNRRQEFRLKFVGINPNNNFRPVLYLITEFDELNAYDYEELKSQIEWDKTKYDTFDAFAFSAFGLKYGKWKKAQAEFKHYMENSK